MLPSIVKKKGGNYLKKKKYIDDFRGLWIKLDYNLILSIRLSRVWVDSFFNLFDPTWSTIYMNLFYYLIFLVWVILVFCELFLMNIEI